MIKADHESYRLEKQALIIIASVLVLATPVLWWFRIVEGSWNNPFNGIQYHMLFGQDWSCLNPFGLRRCYHYFGEMGQSGRVFFSTLVAIYLPLLAGIGCFGYLLLYHKGRVQKMNIVSGMVVEDMEALRQAQRIETRNEGGKTALGLYMFNGWNYSRNRETRHTLIFGAPGSGKTVAFTHMINSAVDRKDKALIFDEKGDYTQIVPPVAHGSDLLDPIIISPEDKRSAIWDIANDLRVAQDAMELAHRIVPDSGHPFFTQSARAVLAGCAIKLMAEKGADWGWEELLAETRQDQETLLRIMLEYQPGSDIFLTADYKQVMSTLGQLEAEMRLLDMLATAWPSGGDDDRERFSLRDWLTNGEDRRSVIIKHSGRYSELSDSWISAFYSVAVSTVSDSNLLGDDSDRRIWFFLDEWGQLPAIKDFERFVTLGRSKGICAVLGLQDVSQIEKNYGRPTLETLLASVGTRIIVRINLGPTADRLRRDFGDTTYEKYEPEASSFGPPRMVKKRETQPAVAVNDFSGELGADKRGVRAFIAGVGKNVYLVTFGYPKNKKERPAGKPAEWTRTFSVKSTFKTKEEMERYIRNALGDQPKALRRSIDPQEQSGKQDKEDSQSVPESDNASKSEDGGAPAPGAASSSTDINPDKASAEETGVPLLNHAETAPATEAGAHEGDGDVDGADEPERKRQLKMAFYAMHKKRVRQKDASDGAVDETG